MPVKLDWRGVKSSFFRNLDFWMIDDLSVDQTDCIIFAKAKLSVIHFREVDEGFSTMMHGIEIFV